MQVAIQRLIELSACKKDWRANVSQLHPHWNHPRLLRPIENISDGTLRMIGSAPAMFGTLSLSALLGPSGKRIMFRGLSKSDEEIIRLFENGMSVENGEINHADNLYAFLVEALVQGPAVIPDKAVAYSIPVQSLL